MIPAVCAPTPRTLWIELTSKCPADCVFCSRKLRRGAGEHFPFAMFESLVDGMRDARRFVLNYSGESTVYPDLIPAIQRARASGAYVELVFVLVTAPESMVDALAESGLNRLTVSVHAADEAKYAEIYRYGSLASVRARLERIVRRGGPRVDLAFVAMDSNLSHLGRVAALAESLGIEKLLIFPVIRRDEIAVQFPLELLQESHRPEFEERVRREVETAEREHPSVRVTICNDNFNVPEPRLGDVPSPYPRALPEGAHIHSCEQNPWETAHVLANGDVVACEVLDKIPLGNLHAQRMDEIWHGDPYQRFRERYRRGEVAESRTCPWKRAYVPRALTPEILGSRGNHAQLLYGWHDPANEDHIWSSQHAVAILAPRRGSRTLHVSGMLPQGPAGQPNELTIRVNGCEAGSVRNPWEETIPFGLDFAVPETGAATWTIEFRTTLVHRPEQEQRDLGFALLLLVSKEEVDADAVRGRRDALEPLADWVRTFDRWAWRLRSRWTRPVPAGAPEVLKPGISVLIPERANAGELAESLAGLAEASKAWEEPIETMVVVNGSPESEYRELRRAYPAIRWQFHPRPLGFGGAVRAGLRVARYPWIYLLNSDAVPERGALRALAAGRSKETFSIASQILLKDTTRFREETNWTTLLIERGLATIHDCLPRGTSSVPGFYSGGGASLFQTRLLARLLDEGAYAPFYWEDVEWGWRARKLGYQNVFCASSIVHHTQRVTIAKLYASEEVERVMQRNRLLFQLRNLTTAGSLPAVFDEIARQPYISFDSGIRWQIARSRLWNHLAPFSDEEVFEKWTRSCGSSGN